MRNNQDELCRSCRALLLVAAALVLAVGAIGCRRKEPASDRGKEDESAAPSLPGLAKLSQAQIEAAQRGGVPVTKEVDLGAGVTMKMVFIPAGSFMMGEGSAGHRVTLTRGLYMGIHEVTQAQWKAVTGSNPAHFKGDQMPVEQVSWNDCQEFIRKLNGLGQGVSRLPTEAEWEYACRAGTNTMYYWGDGSPDAYAWYEDNSGDNTHPVGQKRPNAFGLYDMSGNVYEWCQDWYKKDYYAASPSSDPKGPASAASRVLRGGCWIFNQYSIRSAIRNYFNPTLRNNYVGFRVVWLLRGQP